MTYACRATLVAALIPLLAACRAAPVVTPVAKAPEKKVAPKKAAPKKVAPKKVAPPKKAGDGLGDQIVAAEKVRRQKLVATARNHWAQGNSALKAKKYADAIKHFERVLEVGRWSPVDLDLGDMPAKATQLMARAKRERRAFDIRERQKRLAEIAIAEKKALDRLKRMRQEKITRLFDLALSAMKRRDAKLAGELAEQILREDPTNNYARRLHEDALELSHSEARRLFRLARTDRWRAVRRDFLSSRTPLAEGVQFPDAKSWRRTSRRSEK